MLGDGPPQVVVGRYAEVHEVFSDAERFASELPRGPGYEQFDKFMGIEFMTQMDGERHARLRRLLMPAFSSRRMAQVESNIAAIVEGMLDDIERDGPAFDAMTQYGARLVVGALVATMMGFNEDAAEGPARLPGCPAAGHRHQARPAVSAGLPACFQTGGRSGA